MRGFIVTGSSSGIGLAITNKLIEHDYKVLGIDRSISQIDSEKYEHLKVDINDIYEIHKTNDLIKKFSFYDGLVNSAGITIDKSDDLSKNIKTFEKTLRINLIAPYILSELFFESRRKPYKSSSIINISSIGAIQGFPENPSYCASKGGLESLTRSQALDFAFKKIRVNTIRPGYTETPMNRKSLDNSEKKERRAKKTILGRWGLPIEIANTALFLLKEDSSYITGSVITVDGGWTNLGLKK